MTLHLIGRRIDKDGVLLDADAFLEERAQEYGMTLEELLADDTRSHVAAARRAIAERLLAEGLRQCQVAFLLRRTWQGINHYVKRDRRRGLG